MTHMIPQLELSDEEFERVNNEAIAAGCTVYEYVLLRIGVTQPKPTPPEAAAPESDSGPGWRDGRGKKVTHVETKQDAA